MKFANEVIIKLPVKRVIELFDNADNMKKWQPELLSFDPVSGVPGEVGAKSRLLYKMGRRQVAMIETITVKNLPAEFSGTYEAKGVWNEVKNHFIEIDKNRTKWVSKCHFEFSGFMKVMAFFMPGAFEKQSQKYLDQFKAFAESA